jgi:hypothetical protein
MKDQSDVDVLERKRVFDGRVFTVDRELVKLPHGPTVTLEVVRHPTSVVILPVPGPGQVILIRQYRHAVNRWLWELPAGSVDPGESPGSARSTRRPGTATKRWSSSVFPDWPSPPTPQQSTRTRTSRRGRSRSVTPATWSARVRSPT